MKELDKLEEYLRSRGYSYERIDDETIPLCNRHQIIVNKGTPEQWDAICQCGSYGYVEGLLKIYGSIVGPQDLDSVVGFLTAEDIIKRLECKNE